MAIDQPLAIDLDKTVAFTSFDVIINAMTQEEEGTQKWLPVKVWATSGALADSLRSEQLSSICLECIGAASGDAPLELLSVEHG